MTNRTYPNNDPETIEALEFLTVRHLQKNGWSAEAITGFLVASHAQGGLRPGAPKWLRKQNGFLLAHGKGIEPERVKQIRERVEDLLSNGGA